MQIIKEPAIWKIKKTCTASHTKDGGCEALLEIEAVDIYLSYQQYKKEEDANNHHAFSYTFRCPCCNKETRIDEREIPLEIRKAILSIEQANGTKLKYLKKLGYR